MRQEKLIAHRAAGKSYLIWAGCRLLKRKRVELGESKHVCSEKVRENVGCDKNIGQITQLDSHDVQADDEM